MVVVCVGGGQIERREGVGQDDAGYVWRHNAGGWGWGYGGASAGAGAAGGWVVQLGLPTSSVAELDNWT